MKIELISSKNEFEHEFAKGAMIIEVEIAIKNIRSIEPLQFLFQIFNQEDQQYFINGNTKTIITNLEHNVTIFYLF